MELTLNKKRISNKKIIALGTFFSFSFLMSCSPSTSNVFGFALPLIIISFCCGYRYVVIFFIGLFTSCFLYPANQLGLIISISVSTLFLFASIFKINSTKFMPIILSSVIFFYMFIFKYELNNIILTTLLSLFHGFLYMELIPIFMHQSIEVYSDKRWMILMMIILSCVTSILYVNEMYMFLMIRYILMLCIFYLGIQITIPCIIYLSVALLIKQPLLQNEILSLLLPCLFYFIYLPITKLKFSCMYLFSHILLPLFITYNFYYHSIVIIVSAMLFITTPILSRKNNIITQDINEQTMKNKLTQKANAFSSLFKQLTTLFQDTAIIKPSNDYAKYMYQDVCKKCTSKEYCYRNSGSNRLVKLVPKGVKEGLTIMDCNYIEGHCLKPNQFISNIETFNASYKKILSNASDNKQLRESLFQEFSILGNIFENFSSSINYNDVKESDVFNCLIGYQFDVRYLKKHILSQNTYSLEIGLMATSVKIIKNELIPILEGYLNQKLSLVSIKNTVPYLGYTSILLKHDLPYVIDFGVQQISCDNLYCGDSYTSFNKGNKNYYAISDGMGHGKNASVESKLTIDVLSKLVVNGISLEETLDSINALLRIKNKSDMYTTLDLCTIDNSNSKVQFIKYGAYNSYFIYENGIEVIENKSLPVGVVSDIKMTLVEATINIGDIIVLCSDGIGEYFEKILNKEIHNIHNLTAQEIASYLINKIKSFIENDDCTLLIIKIGDPCK